VVERFDAASRRVEVGIGDDAAVLDLLTGRQLITTDTLIEGVHFDLRYMSLSHVGYKALAVNLSDINAMGGKSFAALGTLGVPKRATESDIDELLDGIADALKLCRAAGRECTLIGGDTVASPQWMVGFTVLGNVTGQPLLRSGAKPGDIVWHSGTLGLSGVEFEQLRKGHQPSGNSHRRPVPPLELGPWLQEHAAASAAQDLSDSLSQVVLQLGQASGVGIELDFREYGFAPGVVAYAKETSSASLATLLLAQAEDYQLLFTTPPELAVQMQSAPVACTRFGRVVERTSGSIYMDERGETHELLAAGFEHL
jgi:thiamine-monophosphate kinase